MDYAMLNGKVVAIDFEEMRKLSLAAKASRTPAEEMFIPF